MPEECIEVSALAAPVPPRIGFRLRWRIASASGRGKVFEDRAVVESWVGPLNAKYGAGTHWVEEVPLG